MIDIIDRLKFDAARCEATFSKGVASNIEDGVKEIARLRAQLASANERLEMCRNQYDAALKRIDALQEELGRF